jgi:hypothetical protein
MATLVFPDNLTDQQNPHVMMIRCINKDTTVDTISVFVPGGSQNGSLAWEHAHDYTDAKMARVALGMLGISPSGSGVLPGMLGTAINPKVEVLYRNTDLRRFQFNFLFAPTSKSETDTMKEIIKTLRYHSAPELVNGGSGADLLGGYRTVQSQSQYLTTGGLFLAPSEFLIDFKFNGKPNEWLPKIGRCIIERIDVNYTPLGEFSTFSNGAPVSAMLTVVFREMKVVDKQNINGGF